LNGERLIADIGGIEGRFSEPIHGIEVYAAVDQEPKGGLLSPEGREMQCRAPVGIGPSQVSSGGNEKLNHANRIVSDSAKESRPSTDRVRVWVAAMHEQ
jgi:hypothetical protein